MELIGFNEMMLQVDTAVSDVEVWPESTATLDEPVIHLVCELICCLHSTCTYMMKYSHKLNKAPKCTIVLAISSYVIALLFLG